MLFGLFIAVFVGVVGAGIVVTGYLSNLIV